MTDNSTPVKNSSGGRRTPVPQLSQSTLNSSQGLYLLHFFFVFQNVFCTLYKNSRTKKRRKGMIMAGFW